MDRPLRILHLEDDSRDADMVRDVLEAGGIACDIARVQTRDEFVAALERGGFDLILADYSLPSFDGMSALRLAAEGMPNVPFIFVSGQLGEEVAIEALKLGAMDYVLKERMSRVVGAVRNALREAEYRVGRKRAEDLVRASEERFRTLVQFSFDVYWETDAQHRFTMQEFGEHVVDPPARGSEIGKTRWEVPYLEPDEEAWCKHRATLDAHRPFRDFELARPTRDGGKRYVSVSGFPMFDETGCFLGYRGVGRNITERKRAEEEHREHLWFLESMDRINRAIQGTQDVERMMSEVLQAALEIFACDRAWLVYPCDPHAVSWHAVMEQTRPEYPGAFALGTQFPVDSDVAAVFSAALAAPGAVLSGPRRIPRISPEFAQQFSIRSQMAMAIDAKADKPHLFGLHQCSREREWRPVEQRLFQEIGRRFGDALASLSVLRRLRDSERKLQAAAQIAQLGWWERDFPSNRVSLSEEVQRIFGVRPGGLPDWQERWLNLIHPEDRAKTAEAAAAAVRGGPRYDVEYRVIRPDGTMRVVHSQADVTWDESSRAVRQFGVLQDVTALRQAEDELRDSEQRYRTLFEKANDAIFLENERDEIIEVNQRACALLGYSREELLTMTVADLQAPELRGQPGSVIRDELEKHGSATFEALDLHRGGRRIPVEVTNTRISDRGQNVVLSVVRDISDRKRTEEELRASEDRYRTLVEFAADAVMLHDEDGKIIDCNRQACENLGYTREELIGMVPADFDADLDREALRRVAERVGAGETLTIETRHRRKDGTLFPVEMRLRQVRKGDRWVTISLSRDITERKRSDEERERLRRLEADLAQMSRVITMGELTASIAHEVNQPLGAMVANAAACERWLAAKPPETAKVRKVLKSITADGQRASEVIGRIRALMKRQLPRNEPVDINGAIREVLALMQSELRDNEVVLRLARQIPTVHGDKVQLQQVLLNLIINAVEAMRKIEGRGRELTIVSRENGSEVLVEVRDSGTGLDAEHAERLFEAFYTTKEEGMGIGLAISRSIVEAHGGRMWAEANAPHGAVFRFSLPVTKED